MLFVYVKLLTSHKEIFTPFEKEGSYMMLIVSDTLDIEMKGTFTLGVHPWRTVP